MARIRTIKPEFAHSESMGRISRDARLCFILLWTIADDSGKTRGSSRILASLLFPYDDDARELIDEWLGELEAEDCIVRYTNGNDTYLQINNWLTHQKIDHPTVSRYPALENSSRILARTGEKFAEDRKGRERRGLEGKGGDRKGEEEEEQTPVPKTPVVAVAPTPTSSARGTRLPVDWSLPDDWKQWAVEAYHLDPERVTGIGVKFKNYWIAKAGADARKANWNATWRNWVQREAEYESRLSKVR